MAASFFFYDLETSGFSAQGARIMQFAGQRTDLQLNVIGEPVNVLIKLTDDIVPDPDAVLVTGLTPQQTLMEGVTEAEFLKLFTAEVATPNTIFLGFNSIRFDDEFMRATLYRNFYDPYEWQWQDGRSRWDLLDVVRMTRALRPDGIKWPFDTSGKPTNRLELLTALNKLEHEHAHDALSDVEATINVARLIRNKQAKLFDYLLTMRDKKKIAELVEQGVPFVYTSGQYPSEFEKTTAAAMLCPHPKQSGGVYVFDLRHDPAEWQDKTAEQLAEAWKWTRDETVKRLPVKLLKYNHCPAVAPLAVLDDASQKRLKLDLKEVAAHAAAFKKDNAFIARLLKAAEILEKQQQARLFSDEKDVDCQLYDGFFSPADKNAMSVVRAAEPSELSSLGLTFADDRLEKLLPLYKARNFPKALTGEERETWEQFRTKKLLDGGQSSRMAKYFARLQDIAARGGLTGHEEYLLEELKLYAESIMPETMV
ncbi:MAG TPA: exodeoxyribonuclease I [Patescibacteria group bacterium]|nr:exodeoxyribonuclease I [Patescibacteria group bacterium]